MKKIPLILFTMFGLVSAQEHFQTVWSGNPFNPFIMFLLDAQIDGITLDVGDEVAAFDGDFCVGIFVMPEEGIIPGSSTIVSSMDDGTGNGYIVGNIASLKIWDTSEGIEISDVTVEWFDLGGNPIDPLPFEAGGMAAINVYGFAAPTNLPPVANAGPDQTIEVPYPYNPAVVTLDGSGSTDSDGTIVSWVWTWAGGSASGETATASFGVGVHTVTLTVTDDGGLTDSDDVIITVNEALNIAPVAAAGNDQAIGVIFPYDPAEVTLDGSGSYDTDGTIVSWEWTWTGGSASGEITTAIFPVGDYTVTLTVTDDDGATGTDQVIISVNEEEFHFQPPNPTDDWELINLGDITVGNTTLVAGSDEIGVFDGDLCVGALVYDGTAGQQLQAWADDATTPEIDGFITGNPISFRYYDRSESMELSPVDIEYIIFDAWDTSGLFDANEITGVNLSFNRAPFFISAPVTSVFEDDLYSYTPSATDDDFIYLDEITITATVLPGWLTFNGSVLSGTPTNNDVGFHDVELVVTDIFLATDTQTFQIEVINTNDPPVVEDLTAVTDEDTPVTITPIGSDPDGDDLTFEIVDQPTHGVITPSESSAPDWAVTLNVVGETGNYYLIAGFAPDATDDFDLGYCSDSQYTGYVGCISAGANWFLDALAPPAPPPPAFDATLSWQGQRYYKQILNGSADDAGVAHTFDIVLQYDNTNLISFSWDNTGWAQLGTFVLQDAFGGLMINIDMTVENSLVLTDPAFNTLKLIITPATETAGWVYTPDENYNGPDSFTYRAYDGELFSDPGTVSITVNPVDDAPVVGDIPDQIINIALGETFDPIDLNTYLTEVDGDVITWTANNVELTVNISNGIATITAPDNWFGAETITFTATDQTTAELSDSDDATFTVITSSAYTLPESWSWKSFPVTPFDDTDAETFFADVLNNLIIVKSQNDGTLIEIDGSWVNQISVINPQEAYMIKMIVEDTFNIDGKEIDPFTPLPLDSAWNWIGFYGEGTPAAQDAFSDVLGSLIVVKARRGALLPTPWGLINGIGNMSFGDGYLAKVSANTGLTWPPASMGRDLVHAINVTTSVDPSYFTFAKTINYHLINIRWLEDSNLEVGHELAVFCDDVCVGSVVYTGNEIQQIMAWEDDLGTIEIDGFEQGKPIRFVYWNGENEIALDDEIMYVEYANWDISGTFSSSGMSGVEINMTTLSNGNEINLPTIVALHRNYPNPFNPVTNIKYDIPQEANVSLTVYNVLGVEVRSLVNGFIQPGYHVVNWNGRDNQSNILSSGVYIYQLRVDGTITDTKKMVLVK